MIHQTNWAGIWAIEQLGNLEYDLDGNYVTLTFPKLIKKADFPGNITNTVALPDIIKPSTFRYSPLRVEANGSINNSWGLVQIDADGFLNIGVDANMTAFETVANAGIHSQSIRYKL